MIVQGLSLIILSTKIFNDVQAIRKNNQVHQQLDESINEHLEAYQAGPPNFDIDDQEERGGFGQEPDVQERQLVSGSVYTELQSGSQTATEYLNKSMQMGGGRNS